MTQRLILIRHAKSSWKDASLSDFERPLNARGLRDAPRRGEQLKQTMPPPDRLISSPAVRALSTARLIAQTWGYPEQAIVTEPGLYDASLETLLDIVEGLDPAWNSVALVGHNPGITELYKHLSGSGIDKLRTSAAVVVERKKGR